MKIYEEIHHRLKERFEPALTEFDKLIKGTSRQTRRDVVGDLFEITLSILIICRGYNSVVYIVELANFMNDAYHVGRNGNDMSVPEKCLNLARDWLSGQLIPQKMLSEEQAKATGGRLWLGMSERPFIV